MFEIQDNDSRLLQKAIKDGQAVLLLGAGTSATSKNVKNEPVKLGGALAKTLTEMAGLPYSGEKLPEVLEAVIGSRVSIDQFHNLIRQEYSLLRPSEELSALFQYTWKRVYSWNVDDAIESTKSGVQIRRYINGLSDKVSAYEGVENVQVVHLHGEAVKPEHGFIFSPKEYNARLNENRHDWYRQAASDYAAHVPIFIGSRMEEPILSAELDRARPSADSRLGAAFLITPDEFTPLQLAGFSAKNIIVIKATLADFVDWLRRTIGPQLTPLDVSKTTNSFAVDLATRITPTRAEVDTAQTILLHSWSDTKSKADSLQGLALSQAARSFLEGQPPTWKIAATTVPLWLSQTDHLYRALTAAITAHDRMFLVYGQSGSGKTTALLQALIKFMQEHEAPPIYELRGDVKSLKASLDLVHRLHKDDHAVVYIGDAFIFSDSIEEDVLSIPHGNLTLISSARTNEWRQHIERRIGDFSTSFEFQRFVRADHQGLVDRLLQYVPAPAFRKLTPQKRLEKLAESDDQLLIALKEATASERFTKVITEEYENLPHEDCRKLFLIVGLATIARTGIAKGAAREAYQRIRQTLSFEGALKHLEGIISVNQSDRYVARHEIYVRHIIENVADFGQLIMAAVEVLQSYTKYNLPIVKNTSRLDGILFKFILNHNFLGEISRRRNEVAEGLKIYQTFEVDFQLDGHFWLQYGQYLAMFGELESALPILEKSIAAFPENTYAVHALADLQLRVAARRPEYDAETVRLLGNASATLEKLHSSQVSDADYYPIVTLAEKHVGALVKHRQQNSATEAARRYFRIISDLPYANEPMTRAKTRLAQLVTHGTWGDEENSSTERKSSKSSKSRRNREKYRRER
ncbi:P-loop NTPase [Rhizobium sp. KDH_Rht_773_N]